MIWKEKRGKNARKKGRFGVVTFSISEEGGGKTLEGEQKKRRRFVFSSSFVESIVAKRIGGIGGRKKKNHLPTWGGCEKKKENLFQSSLAR